MVEPIRQWYQKTTKKALRSLWWATAISFVGAVLFYVLAPSNVHLKLQIFNGAITIPVAGAIWIVSFILLWLVPMRETAFRSQESMERMESRIEERLKKADVVIDRFDRISKQIEDGTHPLLNRMEGHMKAIRERIERDTKPLENPQRRDRSDPPAPLPPPMGLEEIEQLEDALHDGDGQSD